ncbi:MAG TPA: YidB family protein [Steroidobacteraceae bacterium]|nr:YidB family protein [Steroidobacteraceae bacterium]
MDFVLESCAGAQMSGVVNGLIEQHGGVRGIVAQLQQQGLGATARSWVGPGANAPISVEQLQRVFGSERIERLAGRFGVDPEVAARRLSRLLPRTIHKLTPDGLMPGP